MSDEVPLAPMTGWEVAPISAHEAIVLRLSYLTHQTQRLDEAHKSPRFVMSALQCQQLIEALQSKLEVLKSGPPSGSGLPKH
jgi:hypothetical protein